MAEVASPIVPHELIEHFWVCHSPFFESVVLIDSASDGSEILLELYDPDGALINQVRMAPAAGRTEALALGGLLEMCKLEGGMRHAQLIVRRPATVTVSCRIQDREHGAFMGPATVIHGGHSTFFPVTCCDERTYLLALINTGTAATTARCRLFFGKRMPECTVQLPALGSRLLSVSAEFSEYLQIDAGHQVQAYVRLSTKDIVPVGVYLIERSEASEDKFIYSVVS